MIKNVFLRIFVSLPLMFVVVNAQDGVDAIEKARQAKEAADKAAAEAAAATEAAIEAAAVKAAKAAREEAKKKKEDDEARKIAEALAAEEAELDAAASAAAEAAKRKMAEELGLEVTGDVEATSGDGATVADTEAEEVVAKENSGFKVGVALSAGFVSGRAFTSVPTGGTVVVSTPWGFKLGPLDYTISFAFGGYSGQYDSSKDNEYALPDGGLHWVDDFNPSLVGIGGNLTLADIIFTEGHLGNIGEGTGIRGFMGITLEKLNLPVNVLIGGEGFISSDVGGGSQSGWGGLGVRLDYSL